MDFGPISRVGKNPPFRSSYFSSPLNVLISILHREANAFFVIEMSDRVEIQSGEDFGRESSFFQNLTGHMANLKLASTNVSFDKYEENDDYGFSSGVTLKV